MTIQNKRIIKFRAWSVPEKYMYSWDAIVNSSNNYLKEVFDGLQKSKQIPLQFTGFLDKDEKEIYEGDIIKTNNGLIFQVEIPDIYFKLADGCWETENDFKIIGNIYENPELLDKAGE